MALPDFYKPTPPPLLQKATPACYKSEMPDYPFFALWKVCDLWAPEGFPKAERRTRQLFYASTLLSAWPAVLSK